MNEQPEAAAASTDASHEDQHAPPPEDKREPAAEAVKPDAVALADENADAPGAGGDLGGTSTIAAPRMPIEHWAEKHHGLKPRALAAHELHADSGDMIQPGRGQEKLALYEAAKVHAGWASHREVTEEEFHAAIDAFKTITCS